MKPAFLAILLYSLAPLTVQAASSPPSASKAGEKIVVASGTGRVLAAGKAGLRRPDGTWEKLIGVYIEGMRPNALKGKDVMLYFSDKADFQWLLSAKGRVVSYECPLDSVLQKIGKEWCIYLFDKASVKEDA